MEIYCALPKLEELVLIADPGAGATLLLLLDVCSAFQTGTTKLPMSGHWADSLTPPHLDAHCHDWRTIEQYCRIAKSPQSPNQVVRNAMVSSSWDYQLQAKEALSSSLQCTMVR